MGDILKKKGFISNAERAKNIKKLDRGNGGRKIIISAALISGMALGLFVLLGILGQMHIGGAESALSNLEFIRIDDYADFTASCIT
ncbi:hypothetical protein FACS189459_1550 [Bacilli bacterium]|nr:hypothetical protein FACS189459_1550 [Bacilli bacterium]